MNALTNEKRPGTSGPKGSPSVNLPVDLTSMAKPVGSLYDVKQRARFGCIPLMISIPKLNV
jgi:hypothetical protein